MWNMYQSVIVPVSKRPVNPLLPLDEDEEEEDLSGLHPGALLYRSAALQNFPVMADALAHGADVNWVNVAEESSTPLIQAVSAVRTELNCCLYRGSPEQICCEYSRGDLSSCTTFCVY